MPSSFSCNAVFICTHCFSDSAAVTRGSLSSNLACKLFFTLGSGSVHLQFLRLGTFPLGRRLEGKGVFAAYQPMISVTVCTRHQSGMWYASLRHDIDGVIYVLGFVPPCRVLKSSTLQHFPRRKPLVIFFFFFDPPVYLRVILSHSIMSRSTNSYPPNHSSWT